VADQPVYSTLTGSHKKQGKGNSKSSNYTRGDGAAKMRLESKGRGGKSVTVIWNLPWPADEAKAMMKTMQAQFGCGAALKGSQIELQGDKRNQVEQFFAAKSIPIKRAGG
jgi:translation initiation factor 1